MRWTLRFVGILFILLVGYTVWPFVDLYRLGRAVQRGDAAELANRVEMRTLRPSISRQVLAAYLRVAGRDAKLPGFLSDAAIGLGAGMADSALAELVTFERVTALMQEALARSTDEGQSRSIAPMVPRNVGALWELYASSDYKLHHFYVAVPPSFAPEQRFRVHLQLSKWKWKLYGVELPEHLRIRLAEMLLKESVGR